MADGMRSDESVKMDHIAKLTLALAGFMLILLILFPFTMSSDSLSGNAPYLLYSLFLTSVGIVIGISLTWLNDPSRSTRSAVLNTSFSNDNIPMLSSDEKIIIDILNENKNTGKMTTIWQAELVKKSGFTNSKASRILSRMENSGLIRRVRDGMGKRVELTKGGK
tara:strand:+ start:19189 stop:19683 length:495 start_codon:yes stop_codon:yes gene_type:complete